MTPSPESNSRAVVGGCLCGHVRYQVSCAPSDGLWCHCRLCQRAAGAPAVLWAEVRREHFRITSGKLQYYCSSPWARRGFCPQCGTPIVYDGKPDGITDFGIAAATLDNPNQVPVSAHIWTQSMRRGMTLDPHLPQHPQETPQFQSARAQARKIQQAAKPS